MGPAAGWAAAAKAAAMAAAKAVATGSGHGCGHSGIDGGVKIGICCGHGVAAMQVLGGREAHGAGIGPSLRVRDVQAAYVFAV